MKEQNDILMPVEKAKESLQAANSLFDGGFYDFSASRAYYAMFYCAEAVLLTKNLSFSKHSAVITAFGKEFIKTGIFPQKMRITLWMLLTKDSWEIMVPRAPSVKRALMDL